MSCSGGHQVGTLSRCLSSRERAPEVQGRERQLRTGIHAEQLMSDNHWSYTRSLALAELLAQREIKHVFIRPHCPWQNGKVEGFNRTLQTEWAYRQPYLNNQERTDALAPWLQHYSTERHHTALAGKPPISRLS